MTTTFTLTGTGAPLVERLIGWMGREPGWVSPR